MTVTNKPYLQSASCLSLLLVLPIAIMAQNKINYSFFDKPALGGMQMIPSIPNTILTPVSMDGLPVKSSITLPTVPMFGNQAQQQKQIMQEVETHQAAMEQREAMEKAAIHNDLMGIAFYRERIERLAKTKSYHQSFNALQQLNPDSFSLSKAIFLVENAYLDNQLQYDKFMQGIAAYADFVKQILKREGLSPKDNLALNYGIQKLFSQQNLYTDPKTKQTYLVPPLKYDFDDFRGEKDYTKMFVSKVMSTGKGQCHSLPEMYLLIAEQLGAKAQLSLAPQHSFIQFPDKDGRMMNFETTNGKLVSNTWLTQSGYITSMALQNKTYLNALSQKQLYAQKLGDLLLGYLAKMPYDEFAEQIRQKILQINPGNITALIVDANIKTQIAKQKVNAAGKPSEADLPKYPEAYKAYQDMQAAYDNLEASGYQDMPKEAYQKWLQSIEQEKKKQANKALQEKMQREILQLKNLKTSFQRNNKN
jgi:hypothetical protein